METLSGIPIADLDSALDRAAGATSSLRGGRLFLAGGTGFFGRWLLSAIAHANRTRSLALDVTVLTRSRASFARRCPELAGDPSFAFVEGDVRNFAFPEGAFTHVIHAATDTTTDADARPAELIDTIANGTRRMLDFAVAAGVRDVLYASSGAIYGPQGTHERLSETHPGAPLDQGSVYGESKRLGELLCSVYLAQHGLAPKIARCFAFVGPLLPLDAHFAIGNFIADAVAGRPIRIAGDGTPVRSYLYAGDLVAWLLQILTGGAPGRAYNVGSDHALTLAELARLVADTVPGSRGVVIEGGQAGPHPRLRYVPDVDRARADLGLDVWTPLATAIERTASWARGRC